MNIGSVPRRDVDKMIAVAGGVFVDLFELENNDCILALNATFR